MEFASDIFLPYPQPNCPCCSPIHMSPLRPRFSLPVNPNYQVVPIRNNSFYRQPTAKSLQSLYTFGKTSHGDDPNNNYRHNVEPRTTPYYYNELTQMHAPPSVTNPNSLHFTNSSNVPEDEDEVHSYNYVERS